MPDLARLSVESDGDIELARVAGEVDALPEARRGKQHRIRRFAKPLQQAALGCAALQETRILNLGHGQIVK